MSGDAVYRRSNKGAGFQSVKSKEVWHVEHTLDTVACYLKDSRGAIFQRAEEYVCISCLRIVRDDRS